MKLAWKKESCTMIPNGKILHGDEVVVVGMESLNCVWFFATPWTVTHQAPLSLGFPRQEYWSGLPCPSPGDLPDPGTEPAPLLSPALAGGCLPPGKPQAPPGQHEWLLSYQLRLYLHSSWPSPRRRYIEMPLVGLPPSLRASYLERTPPLDPHPDHQIKAQIL